MAYPLEILPNTAYKYIDCDLRSFYLLRHSELQSEEFYDSSTNKVTLAAICSPKENIVDLSTSLLGVFKNDYIKIQLTEEGNKRYNEYCEPNEPVPPPQEDDYTHVLNRNAWYIQISLLQGLTVPYNKGEDEMFAECEILHTPMRWNFWHFSIRWTVQTEQFRMGKNAKKWEQRLCNAARNILSEIITITKPFDVEIPASCYHSNA